MAPLRPIHQPSIVLKFGISDSKPDKILVTAKLFSHSNASSNRKVAANANAALAETSEPEPSRARRIILSDVVVKRPRSVFLGRKWNSLDMGTAGVVLAMHFLSLFAPFQFNWGAFWVAIVLYIVTGLFGITLSFHRNLSHRSFKVPKWLEYLFAYCGVQALQVGRISMQFKKKNCCGICSWWFSENFFLFLCVCVGLQGNPIDWVSTHRYHHQFCDSERDPHSPNEGFWFSHMSWLFDTNSIIARVWKFSLPFPVFF